MQLKMMQSIARIDLLSARARFGIRYDLNGVPRLAVQVAKVCGGCGGWGRVVTLDRCQENGDSTHHIWARQQPAQGPSRPPVKTALLRQE